MFSAAYALDVSIANALDSGRSPFFVHAYQFFTQLGDARVITIVALSLLFVLWRHRRFAYKAGLLVSLFGALGTSYAIKLIVERPRPLPPHPIVDVAGYSFPSMHAAVSMATYGFLMYITWKLVHPPHHRAPAIAALLGLICLIGYSRVYLGAHYASDVVGGYVVGALFVLLGIYVTRALSSKDRGASKAAPSGR